MHETSIKKLYN